jgi:Holliday junction DNA helicase RuvA
MISFIRGILAFKEPKQVIVDVNGVGYAIDIPPKTETGLPEIGSEVTFYTRYRLTRDNEPKLYGFTSRDELKVFEIAVTVSRVGPGSALNIVARLSPVEFQRAVRDADHTTLMRVPRINKEIAQLIIMKLKNSIRKIQFETQVDEGTLQRPAEEAIKALMSLDVSEEAAERALLRAQKAIGDSAGIQDLIRLALRYVRR